MIPKPSLVKQGQTKDGKNLQFEDGQVSVSLVGSDYRYLVRKEIPPMQFEYYLREQLKKHPSMQIQDVIKLCYQAAYGAEHLLSDPVRAKKYLERELAEVIAADGELYEQISPKVCRVNLSAWKAKGLPIEWLFRMFAASCKVEPNGEERFRAYLSAAEHCLVDTVFTENEWTKYLDEYQNTGMPAVHHSGQYRIAEHPSYRIVESRFCRTISVLERAKDYVHGDQPCVIAMDGRAASGKTTLAESLRIVLDADVIHMDDFFLPPALRTEDRLSEAGGNIHYERFLEEVIPNVLQKKPFAYRIFDCGKMDFCGVREIGDKPFRIIEGSYSHHPKFGRYADITVFLNVSPEAQIKRIRARNGEKMLERFLHRWIPMEEKYFAQYSIGDHADITVDSQEELNNF